MMNPMMIVFSGTSEFKMEATALSISVIANENRKAGKKVPKNQEIAIHFNVFFDWFFSPLKPAMNNISPEMTIRKAPN